MFRSIKFFAVVPFACASIAAAAEYRPLVVCENGKVVLDKVIGEINPEHQFQVVIHDKSIAHSVFFNGGISGEYFNDRQVMVVQLRNALRGSTEPFNLGRVASEAHVNGDQLGIYRGIPREGNLHQGNYVFRGCKSVK